MPVAARHTTSETSLSCRMPRWVSDFIVPSRPANDVHRRYDAASARLLEEVVQPMKPLNCIIVVPRISVAHTV